MSLYFKIHNVLLVLCWQIDDCLHKCVYNATIDEKNRINNLCVQYYLPLCSSFKVYKLREAYLEVGLESSRLLLTLVVMRFNFLCSITPICEFRIGNNPNIKAEHGIGKAWCMRHSTWKVRVIKYQTDSGSYKRSRNCKKSRTLSVYFPRFTWFEQAN